MSRTWLLGFLCVATLVSLAFAASTVDLVGSSTNNNEVNLQDYTPKDRSSLIADTNRAEIIEDAELADRAGLLFRRLDVDFDKKIGEFDAVQSSQNGAMADHMPGISLDEFKDFINLADKDHDGHLNREEFFRAIAEGLKQSHQAQQAPQFLETEENLTKAKRKAGFIGAVVDNLVNKATGFLRGLAGLIDKTQDGCVMCQYIVERIETNVKASGALSGAPGGFDDDVMLEVASSNAPALVEVDQQGPFRQSGSAIIASSRQATRFQRQVERQKFNEIYRIADITLDDVCEQGMPNAYYGFCKSIYKVQTDVVDGIRYQYRPSDICFRVGMCGKKSYITKGIHSRYK